MLLFLKITKSLTVPPFVMITSTQVSLIGRLNLQMRI